MAGGLFTLLRRTALLWVAALVGVGSYFVIAVLAESDEKRPSLAAQEEPHDHSTHDHSHDGVNKNRNDPFGVLLSEDADSVLPSLDPCTLLTKDEAQVVLGTVTTVVENGAGAPVTNGQRICRYAVEESETNFGAVIGITDTQARDKLSSLAKFYNAPSVDGIGDRAHWIGPYRVLAVAEGKWFVHVQMLSVDQDLDALKANAIELVDHALERLSDAEDSSVR